MNNNKFENFLLSFLAILMIFLFFLNWTIGLDINFYTISNFLSNNSSQKISTLEENFVPNTPYKLGITKNNTLYSSVYNDQKTNEILNNIGIDINTLFSDPINITSSSEYEFFTAFNRDENLILEYFCPLSTIIDTDISFYIGHVILINKSNNIEMYIKDGDNYYSKTIQLSSINFDITDGLSTDFTLEKSDNNTINFISNKSITVNKLNIIKPQLDHEINNLLSTYFLYNPLVMKDYVSIAGENIYINDFSTLNINENFIEFKSNESRGNIFFESFDTDYYISTSLDIFDNIANTINSNLKPYIKEVIKQENTTTIILGSKFNSIPFNSANFDAVFSFSSSGLSYAKIYIPVVFETEQTHNLLKSNILDFNKNIILSYDENGNLDYRYISRKE